MVVSSAPADASCAPAHDLDVTHAPCAAAPCPTVATEHEGACVVTCTVGASGVVRVSLRVVDEICPPPYDAVMTPAPEEEKEEEDDSVLTVTLPENAAVRALELAPGTADEHQMGVEMEAAAEEAEEEQWELDAPHVFQPLPVVVYVPPPQTLAAATTSFVTARRLEHAPASAAEETGDDDDEADGMEVEADGPGDYDNVYDTQLTLTQPTPTVAALLQHLDSPPASPLSTRSMACSSPLGGLLGGSSEEASDTPPAAPSSVRAFVPPPLSTPVAPVEEEEEEEAASAGAPRSIDGGDEATRLKAALDEQVRCCAPCPFTFTLSVVIVIETISTIKEHRPSAPARVSIHRAGTTLIAGNTKHETPGAFIAGVPSPLTYPGVCACVGGVGYSGRGCKRHTGWR